jgi:hypothetical protein
MARTPSSMQAARIPNARPRRRDRATSQAGVPGAPALAELAVATLTYIERLDRELGKPTPLTGGRALRILRARQRLVDSFARLVRQLDGGRRRPGGQDLARYLQARYHPAPSDRIIAEGSDEP